MNSLACSRRSLRPMDRTTSAKKASSFNRNRSISRRFIPQKIHEYDPQCQDKLNVVVLDPSVIAGWGYQKFVQTVSSGPRRVSQENRLRAIWQRAVASVGCEVGPAVEVEAQVMVEGLRQIRESIQRIEEEIHESCSQFPGYEYLLSIPGFGPDVSSKVLGPLEIRFDFRMGDRF